MRAQRVEVKDFENRLIKGCNRADKHTKNVLAVRLTPFRKT